MSRGEQIDTVQPTDAPQTFNVPLSDLGAPAAVGLNLFVDQCVEGGWTTEYEDGRTFDTDGTFNYTIELEFESQKKVDELLDRSDVDEIHNTMMKTVTELSGLMLTWERGWDHDPDAYADGVVPENPAGSFTEFAIEGFNEQILPEFVQIMQATYPEMGLTGATIVPESAGESPGCYQGAPENLAGDIKQEEVTKDVVTTPQSNILKM